MFVSLKFLTVGSLFACQAEGQNKSFKIRIIKIIVKPYIVFGRRISGHNEVGVTCYLEFGPCV